MDKSYANTDTLTHIHTTCTRSCSNLRTNPIINTHTFKVIWVCINVGGGEIIPSNYVSVSVGANNVCTRGENV